MAAGRRAWTAPPVCASSSREWRSALDKRNERALGCGVRVLVTGGTGFVGSHSVRALIDAGHDVRLLVRSPSRIAAAMRSHGLDDPEHVVGDVTDPRAVSRA